MTRSTAAVVARLSWIIPLFGMVSSQLLRRTAEAPCTQFEQGEAEGQACVLVLVYIVGAVLAVIALRAVAKLGPAGIRTQALIGLVLNGILLLTFAVLAFTAIGS